MPRRFQWMIAIGLIGSMAPICAAAGKPDLSTPKSAALAFVRAMEADDMDTFKGVTIGNADDYRAFEPLLAMVGAAKRMERAARTKFGKAGRVIVRDSPAVELEVHIQESDVKVNDSTAVLRHKADGGGDPLTLRQSGDVWKVDLTAIPNRSGMEAAVPGMTKMREALEEFTGEIKAGKFKTAEEAEQVLVKRMQQASASAASSNKQDQK